MGDTLDPATEHDVHLDTHDGHHHHADEAPGEGIFNDVLTQDTLVCSILICIVAVVGLIGNTLMLRAWIKYPNLRNAFYTVFAALSLVDILYLLIGVPATVLEVMEMHTISNESWCKASRYLIHVFGFISAYLVVTLAALRALLLINRDMFPRPTAKHLVVYSIVIYVIIFIISYPIIDMYSSLDGFCYFDPGVDNVKQTWLLNSFSSFVPLILVFLFYLICYILGKRYFADSYSPRYRQKSRLVSSVVLAFIVCQIPYRILSIYEVYLQPNDEEEYLKVITAKDYLMSLLMAGKAIRPILCSKLTTDLGHAFDEIINCQSCQKSYNRANGSLPQTPPLQPELLPGEDTPVPPPPAYSDPEICLDAEEESPSRSRTGVDRTISTSSTVSNNSQAPLIRLSSSSSPSEIEMM